MLPTSEQAIQFAVMLEAGVPPSDAVLYFLSEPTDIAVAANKWPRCAAVRKALMSLQSKPWEKMSLEEKMTNALDYHYTTLAYVLRSNHYGEVDQATKSKLDAARVAIESKLAGTAGKTDALTRFFDDLAAGRVKALAAKPAAQVIN